MEHSAVGGIGGALGCEGAILLQCEHRSRILCMSAVIPGQNMDDCARDIMDDAPWWAECKFSNISVLSRGGTTILFF